MTDPAGGPPAPQGSGNWQAPPPPSPPGGFQAAPVAAGPAAGVVYADTVSRVIAYIIDVILFFVVGLLLIPIAIYAVLSSGSLAATTVVGLIALAGSAVYFIWTWMHWRATVGQRAMHLEVANAADGATLTQDQAIRRWAWLFGPSAIGSVLGYSGSASLGAVGSLIGFLAFLYQIYLLYTVSQDPKRQGYHDKQVDTVVIKRLA